MKKLVLIFALLLCPALCFGQSAPFAQSPIYRIDATGKQAPATKADAAAIAALYNAGAENSTTYIQVGGTYTFTELLTGAGRIIGCSPTDVVLEFDGFELSDLSAFLPKCWGMTVRADDGERVIGFPVGANGELVTEIRLRTGTAEEIEEIVLAEGEPAWKTDTYQLVVGDGETAGGKPAGSAQPVAVVISGDGISGQRPYYPSANSNSARGEAVEAAWAAMASGIGANDVLEISANASLSNPLSGSNVSRSVVVKPNVTLSNSSGSVFSITGLSSLKIENQGRIVGSDNAISLDVSTGTYVFGGTGIYESTGSGKSALRFTASLSTELYLHGGHWVANSGTAVTATNSSSRLNILPAASVDTISAASVFRWALYDKFPGTAFLSLIDDASASDIRNTAGASSGVFPIATGGTGQSSYTQGDLLYYNSGTTLSKLAKSTTAGHVLKNSGTNNNPAWGQVAVGDLSGLGTGVATALGVNVGSAGAPVLFNGAGGTPSSITLTNGTGLPLSSGVTGVLPSANGGAGTVNGILKANGSGTTSAAVAGTDYVAAPVLPNLTGTCSSLSNSAADTALAANTIFWQPIVFNRAGTQAVVSMRVATGAVGTCKAFIYDINADGTIGSAIATSDEPSINVSNSLVHMTATGSFAAKTYAVGIVLSTGATIGVTGGGETTLGYYINGTSTTTAIRSLTTSHTYANAAPSTPTITPTGNAHTPRIVVTISTP